MSNDTNRAARKLKRQGFDGAAERVALQGAAEQLAGGGSNITSADSNQLERDKLQIAQRGLSIARRDATLRPDTGGGAAPAGATATRDAAPSGRTTNASLNEARPGETPSQVYARQQASRAGTPSAPPSTAIAPPSTAIAPPAAPGTAGSTLQGPPRPAGLTRPEPPREGRINGMPASQAIAGAQRSLASGGPRQEYGGDIGTNNISKLGISGAVADYYRRSQLDAERPARAAAWLANETASGPGNMADVESRKTMGPPKPVVGPAQRAMNEALARREGYAADSAAAGKITAGLNTSPTPRLDTSFPVAPAPRELAGPPASAAAPPPSLGYRLGRGVLDTVGNDALESTGRKLKRGAGQAAAAVTGAADAVGVALGDSGLRAGRKLKRNALDFRAGLSGR